MHQLQEADADLERSYKLSKDANLTSELVSILHRKGHVAWELGRVEEAEEHFNESARLAVEVHDFHQAVNNLEGLVELYYDIGRKHHENKQFDLRDEWYEKAKEIAEQWKAEYEDEGFDFPLYSGSRSRILGNIAYDREKYGEALDHYLKAYPRIASRGGYSKYALTEALDLLQERIDRLPPQVALEWCDRLEAHWKEMGLSGDFPEMLSVCEICRDNAKRRAQDIAGKIANNGGES
jgi:tetratricopeptide (TPR) repeat protein